LRIPWPEFLSHGHHRIHRRARRLEERRAQATGFRGCGSPLGYLYRQVPGGNFRRDKFGRGKIWYKFSRNLYQKFVPNFGGNERKFCFTWPGKKNVFRPCVWKRSMGRGAFRGKEIKIWLKSLKNWGNIWYVVLVPISSQPNLARLIPPPGVVRVCSVFRSLKHTN